MDNFGVSLCIIYCMQCIEWLVHNTAQSKPRGGRLWLMADPHSVNPFSAKECALLVPMTG